MSYTPQAAVVFDYWGQLAADLDKEAEALRRLVAGAILTNAQNNAPEITGGLKASGYLIDEGLNTYADAVAAATAKNPDMAVLPQIEPEKDTTIVAFAASYATANEYYTGTASPGAHPYLTPAALAQQPTLDRAVEQLGGKLT